MQLRGEEAPVDSLLIQSGLGTQACIQYGQNNPQQMPVWQDQQPDYMNQTDESVGVELPKDFLSEFDCV